MEKYKPVDHPSYENYYIDSNKDKGCIDFWYCVRITKEETVALVRNMSTGLNVDQEKIDIIIEKINVKHKDLFMSTCAVSNILEENGFLKPICELLDPVKEKEPSSVSFSSVNDSTENWNEILYIFRQEMTVKQLLKDINEIGGIQRSM